MVGSTIEPMMPIRKKMPSKPPQPRQPFFRLDMPGVVVGWEGCPQDGPGGGVIMALFPLALVRSARIATVYD